MKKVLVIGAALSGIAVSRLLNKKGYDVVLTDMKKVNEQYAAEDLVDHRQVNLPLPFDCILHPVTPPSSRRT